jgi:hypothetical protein
MAASPTAEGAAHTHPPGWARWALGFGVLVMGLQWIGRGGNIDLDVFHEMALIREALTLGRIPLEDSFSYTSTVLPVVHHEWATGAVLYFIVVTLGLGATGLAILRFLLLAGIVACCVAVARSRGAGWAELTLAAPLTTILFLPGLSPVRAQMFTFLFLAILLLMLERERAGQRRWVFLWPPLFILWLNLHGGFVVGAGVLALYTVERFLRATAAAEAHETVLDRLRLAFRETRHLFLAVGVMVPLVQVNPYGTAYIPYLWHALTMDRPYIREWHPLWSPRQGATTVVMFGCSLLLAAYSAWRGKSWSRLPGILILLAMALLAARSVRILPIYGTVWFAYVSAALAATPLAAATRMVWQRFARRIAIATLVIGALSLGRIIQDHGFAVHLPTEPGDGRVVYPAGAVGYLEEIGFHGNLMTPFGVGAYVSWNLHPAVLVGMDSRYEVAYDPAFAEEVKGMYLGDGDWREILARHPTDGVLVPTGGRLEALIAADSIASPEPHPDPRWVEVFRDDAYAIFATPEAAQRMPRVDRQGQPITGTFP